jgi:hypothetical protein
MKKKIYYEVNRVQRFSDSSVSEHVVLIPGLNIFRNGPFKSRVGNNLMTSLFVYKEHIYLNSDRLIEEGEIVFNEKQFMSDYELFKLAGLFVNGFVHEEIELNVKNNNWTLKKSDLCKESDCLKKSGTTSASILKYILKYEFNQPLFNYCQ